MEDADTINIYIYILGLGTLSIHTSYTPKRELILHSSYTYASKDKMESLETHFLSQISCHNFVMVNYKWCKKNSMFI